MSQVRAERVANGSRRQRDLAAVGAAMARDPELEAWITANLPGEGSHAVSAVRFHLKKLGQPITAASVHEGLRERGWLKEQNS